MNCYVTLNEEGEDWVWYCEVCDKKGEPADVITAYWGALVHKEFALRALHDYAKADALEKLKTLGDEKNFQEWVETAGTETKELDGEEE